MNHPPNAESNRQRSPCKLYSDLAAWWPLLSAVDEYAEEAAFFRQVLDEAAGAPPQTVLELGSGGGNNAWHLAAHYQLTLVDLSAEMLAVSRALNPACEHHQGDMRTVRLGRQFDAVFIHDAIMYMTTEDDLRRAIATAAVHCRAGGIVLLVPDEVRETFEPSTDHGGHDGPDRALRYLEWSYDPDESDTQITTEYVYLLRVGTDQVTVESERHICGLFPRAIWLRLLQEAGFTPRIVVDTYGRDLFVGVKA
ncbi:MAG: class I SAM-dependent methyltransferase [Anaerolineae bacterium]|nr:class I SAM-dependent methyltransferase [Anaerolineae bacterium]